MSAGGQDRQRSKREPSHAGRVAQIVCGVAVACSCGADPAAPPVDPDDLDGDGVPNERDVCPTDQDPSQHDEDGDGFGDACDVCPTIVDPLQADQGELDGLALADGVGDACDLRPSSGGDKLRALHTFAVDTTPAWLGAGWTIADDRARTSSAARWQHQRAESGSAVFARLAVESMTFTGAGAMVSIALDGDGIESARSCALLADRDGDGNDELEVRELQGAIATRALTGALAGAAAGPLELVVLRGVDRVSGGKVVCRLHYRGDSIEASIDTIDNTTTGQYVLAADGADVIVTSLAVYGSPIACPSAALAACNPP